MALDTSAGAVALNQLGSLPLGYLIGEPLKAAISAQALAAETTVDFIKTVGFEDIDGKLSAINLEFIFEDGGSVFRRVRVPLLLVTPIPFIVISTVDIQFKAKIDASASQSSSDSLETNFSMGGSFTRAVTKNRNAGIQLKKVNVGGSRSVTSNLTMSASYSSKKDSKATQESKYSVEYTLDIQVHAEQAGMPQGMAAVLNILQEGISKKPLDTQITIFGLSQVNKIKPNKSLTDGSFMVLVLDAGGEPVDDAVVKVTSSTPLVAPAIAPAPAEGVYTVPTLLDPSAPALTAGVNEILTITVTTGTAPDEEVTTLTREVLIENA